MNLASILPARHHPRAIFWSVSLGHFAIDLLNSTGPVLMAFLSAHIMPMTATQVGLAISGYQLAGSLSQPFAGWLADKTGGRWLGAGGIFWTASFLTLAVLLSSSGSYLLMLIPFVLAALGSGAYHPVGTMHAAESSRRGHGAGDVSIFFLLGQLGGSLGPVLAGVLLDRAATNNGIFTAALPAFNGRVYDIGQALPLLLLALVALPGVLITSLTLPTMREHQAKRAAAAAAAQAGELKTAINRRVVALLVAVISLRSLINPGTLAFVPLLFQSKGWSAADYGLVASMYWLGSGLAGVVLGFMAERYDSRLLIAVSMMLAAPCLFVLPALEVPLIAALFSLLTGGLSGASHSLLVVQAQRMIPGRKGLASGAILGFMFACGAVGSLILGWMSDLLTIPGAFQVVAFVTVITGLLGLGFPREHPAKAGAAKVVSTPSAGATVLHDAS